MSKTKSSFFCQQCGHESPKWLGKCPSCNNWNTFVEEVSASNSQRKIIIPEMIDRITNMTENEFANYSMEHGHNELENLMIDVYFEFIGYIEKQDIVNIIRCLESSDNRKFNNMRLSAVYAILDDNDHFKRAVTHNIKIGTRHTKEELLKLWSVIIMETGVRISLKSAIDAVKITKLYFLVKKDKRAKEHKIEGINPNSFNVIMKKDTSSFKFNINDLYKDSKWDT